jgi:hypothetical protein
VCNAKNIVRIIPLKTTQKVENPIMERSKAFPTGGSTIHKVFTPGVAFFPRDLAPELALPRSKIEFAECFHHTHRSRVEVIGKAKTTLRGTRVHPHGFKIRQLIADVC